MSKTTGMPGTDSARTETSNVDSSPQLSEGTMVEGSRQGSVSNMESTGVQTTGGGQVPSHGFAEVPVAPCKFGEYDLIEEIARGGMGVVYRAKQTKLNRIVALKMILPGMLSSPTAIDRFYEEARAAAVLDHPNIVPIYDIGESAGQHYFTMAFIEGRSLRDLIRKETINFAEAIRLLKGIAEGVAFAHDHKIIHRDLKPDNVLIDKQGRPRVTDFGLAKRTDSTTGLTVTGQILGTPTYMSPEQALGGNRNIGTPTDIYAVGGILYYALTGQPPFQGETMTEVLCQVITTPPNSPKMYNPRIPDELEAICMKCLEKEPEKRYASCHEFRDALVAWELSAGIAQGSVPLMGSSPSTPKVDTALSEDSLFAGLPKSFPPSNQKSTPQRKPWDYTSPSAPPAMEPISKERAIPELSGSRPIVLPSDQHAAVQPPPEPKKNYGLMIAVMVSIFAVTVLLVSQWPKWFSDKGTVVVQDDKKSNENNANITPDDQKKLIASNKGNSDRKVKEPIKEEVEVDPKIEPKDLDKFLTKMKLRSDFPLKVEMVGGRLDPDGIRRFKEGDIIQFDVTPEQDCFVAVWALNGDGTLDQVFPHTDSREHFLKANQTKRVPEVGIDLRVTVSVGTDVAWILAADRPFNPEDVEKADGIKFLLKEREWHGGFLQQRGLIAVRKDVKLSENTIRYQVMESK